MTQLHVNKVRSLQSLPLADEPITIGRSSSNQVVLPSNRVSREHCVIEVIEEGTFRVRDLGSRHGTTVNGQRVSEQRVGPGDVIGVGAFAITVDDPMAPSSSGLALAVNGGATAATAATAAATAELESRRKDLERQVAVLGKRLEDAEAGRAELEAELATTRERHAAEAAELRGAREQAESEAVELRRAREQAESEAAELRRAREQAGGEAETQRSRAETNAAELDQAREEHGRRQVEAEAARRELLEKLGATTTALDAARATAEKADRQLQSQTHALDDALARASGLETRVNEAEAAQRSAAEESRAAERSMARLRETIGELHAASDRVTISRENLAALEGLWLEADERLQQSEQLGEVELADSLQRDAVGNHLEEAHAECDATVAELQEVAGRLARLIATEVSTFVPAATTTKTGRRRPSMFRRSSRA